MVTVRERIEVAEGKEEKFLSQKILCHLCGKVLSLEQETFVRDEDNYPVMFCSLMCLDTQTKEEMERE
jgi:hemolysin-activating ACP:hemolysin acyltransferase